MLMREGPGSLVGVGEARAVRGGPSWSLATTGESDVNFWTLSLTEPTRRNWDGPASEVGSRFGVGCRGLSTDSERWQDFVSDGSALLVLEKPLMESKVSEGSVGPGRGLLMTRPRELDGTGDMGGSGLGASEGCGSGSELTGASTAGHWAPAGSSRGSGEALVGELWGEAGELGLPPGGALSRSVTVVTSWLVSSGVGVGSSTSVCCSCCSGSGTCRRHTGRNQGFSDSECYPHPQRTKLIEQAMQSRGAGHGFPRAHLHKEGWSVPKVV